MCIVGVLVVLASAVVLLRVGLDLPPVELVAAHGFPPAGGPTGREITIEGVRFVEIGTGYFQMGSWFRCSKGDALGRICKALHLPWGNQPLESGHEVPVRWVTIRQSYYIADCEITNLQYERFDPSHERGMCSKEDDSPVVEVTWDDARAYCDWIAHRSGLPVRLPSEAEWENACRAGSRTEYCFGDDEANLGKYAWFGGLNRSGNWEGWAQSVMTRHANLWGLFDMHGNVWEWCEDRWHDDYHGAPEDAEAWRTGASPFRVLRGGSWRGPAVDCRSAARDGDDPGDCWVVVGFRPAAGSSVP